MTKLLWGEPGERLYETGADRGVLFVGAATGVPWNGLVSVSEAPLGGEPSPYYLDGIKYLNVSTNEEFEATLQAFSSPLSFSACDGTASIANGLYATQQPRKPFGLSYRTLLGNDVKASDYGYKLHIVYNALAAPATKEYVSLGGASEPTMLSWPISTTPVVLAGRKPTAHFIINSTLTPTDILQEIEDLLYGTEETMSSLPTPAELIAIFTS